MLAVPAGQRKPTVANFDRVPYLNSSLFEITELENEVLRVNSLRDQLLLPLAARSVLGTRPDLVGTLQPLHYLFAFLDAYDFTSEGKAKIQEENKRLINASVLGLIFEKINGYRDGSFYTPGFITEYMCRETIRRAVVQRFRADTSSSHYRSNEPDAVQVDELIVQGVHGPDRYDPEDRAGGIPQLDPRFEFSEQGAKLAVGGLL